MHRAELVEHIAHDAAEQARQSTATELITMLAHDLRAPLAPIQGYLAMIQRTAETEGHAQYCQYATRALRSVRRLERMLSDLMDATRLDQGIFALTPQPVNLAALVEDSAEARILAHETTTTMIGALARLPQRQREVLTMRYYLDLSEAEIADALGISAGSVKSHAHRGLAALRDRMEAAS